VKVGEVLGGNDPAPVNLATMLCPPAVWRVKVHVAAPADTGTAEHLSIRLPLSVKATVPLVGAELTGEAATRAAER
jgi:hypothetical protein